MNPVIDTLKVNLRSKKYQSITVKQYDENTRLINVELFDNDKPYNIEDDVDVIFRCTKSDDTYVLATIPHENISNNLVKINLPAAALTKAGEVRCDIGIYKKSDNVVGKQVLSSQLFYLYVEQSAYDETALCSSNEYSVLIKLIDDINTAIEYFNKLVAENQERLNEKVDKVEGMGLSENSFTNAEKGKLEGIEERANNYTHPDSHPATIIVEDANHRFVTDVEKALFLDKYTKDEIDNQFSSLESNIDWKESVKSYEDIAATYPYPVDGWTVNVNDTDYTYRYDGNEWIAISANAIPKATSSVDGLMTINYVKKLNGIEDNANNYEHPLSHPASMVQEDAEHNFVNKSEKTILDIFNALKIESDIVLDGGTFAE